MIYTVTFNPSLDYIVQVSKFQQGLVNRSSSEEILVGGKGINVSIVLKNLGYQSTVWGFIGGFVGQEIENRIQEAGCITDFVHLEHGISRINIKLKSDEESEINGLGPQINAEKLEELYQKLTVLKEDDILVIAGSAPSNLSDDIYQTILDRINYKRIQVVVDATGELLLKVLKYHPFLVKPNTHELEEIFHTKLECNDDIIFYGRKLQTMGARNVIISMASEGAIMLSELGDVYYRKAPKGTVVNSVGAGDSMVAGFLAGYQNNHNYQNAFDMGVAAGSAKVFSHSLPTKDEIMDILSSISGV